jgi:hypothetical protein
LRPDPLKAFADREALLPERGHAGDRDLSMRARAGRSRRSADRNMSLPVALDLGEHAVLVVEHEAGESVTLGQAIDERAKPDALHGAAHPDPQPFRPAEKVATMVGMTASRQSRDRAHGRRGAPSIQA